MVAAKRGPGAHSLEQELGAERGQEARGDAHQGE
jgi:hypothetical protein